MKRSDYRVWAAAALGLCFVGAVTLLAWLWLDVHTTGFVPIALQSALRADYSVDPRNPPLAALNLGIIEQVLADQPTASPAPTGASPVTPSMTPIPITILLQTPVPSVTPILRPGQPSPTPRPSETSQPTLTPSAVMVPSVTPETSASPPVNATAVPGVTSTLANVATPSRTSLVSIPTATATFRPPTAIVPTATLAAPTNTFVPPPTNTRAPTAAPSFTAVPPSDTPLPPPTDTPVPPPTNTPNAYPPPPPSPPATGYP